MGIPALLQKDALENERNTVQAKMGATATDLLRQSGQLTNLPTALGGTGGRFGFGALTNTMDPRRIQLAAKFYF